MKTLIVLMFVLFGFTQCGETEMVNPENDVLTASVFPSSVSNYIEKGGSFSMRSSCPQNSNYTVQLKTLSGVNIAAANVQPSTEYRIVITYTTTYVCCANPAYWVVSSYGFTGTSNDATNGSTTIGITTDSVLPPFGIIGVVGPTDCTGGKTSAVNSPGTTMLIP